MTDIPDKTYFKHELFKQVVIDIRRVDPSLCVRGTFQTRVDFKDQELHELADSLLQTGGNYNPVVVRPRKAFGDFEIIAGERRVRASMMAELPVLAMVGDFDDEQAAVITITENMQREDLNIIEEAEALQRMIDEVGVTHAAVAQLVGKSRIYVTNTIRLLKLDIAVRDLLRAGKLGAGHARPLLALNTAQQREVARLAASHGWSARKVEEKVRALTTPQAEMPVHNKDKDVANLEDELSEMIGQPCRISFNKQEGGGNLQITFFSPMDFENVLTRLGKTLD